jgi:hypothetical protein
MWKRILLETSIVAVQTVALIGLCATVGVSGSGRKAERSPGGRLSPVETLSGPQLVSAGRTAWTSGLDLAA